jgi:hypothetical protein
MVEELISSRAVVKSSLEPVSRLNLPGIIS